MSDPEYDASRTPAVDRDATADDRDTTASGHDELGDQRDVLGEQRDARARNRESESRDTDRGAAADRNAAHRDRLSAKADRRHARDDRAAARADRSLSAEERSELLLDELTGAYRRAAGFLELEREIVKAERTGQQFVLAFIDVDGLKLVNDTQGHGAGDQLLRDVVACMRGVLREYDVFIRYGGDEFICGVPDLALADIAARFDEANAQLVARAHASVSVGLAERAPGEDLDSLIDRADAAMYEARELRDTAEREVQ